MRSTIDSNNNSEGSIFPIMAVSETSIGCRRHDDERDNNLLDDPRRRQQEEDRGGGGCQINGNDITDIDMNTAERVTPSSSDTELDNTYGEKDRDDKCEDDDDDDTDVPDEFICPLTMEIFNDPLMDRRGMSFERKAIVEWLNRGNDTCPLTRQRLSYSSFIPNANLKMRVERWKEDHGYYDKHNKENSVEGIAESGKSSRRRRAGRDGLDMHDDTDDDDTDDDYDDSIPFIGTIDAPPNSMLDVWWTRERLMLLNEYNSTLLHSSQGRGGQNISIGSGRDSRRRRNHRRRREGRNRSSSDTDIGGNMSTLPPARSVTLLSSRRDRSNLRSSNNRRVNNGTSSSITSSSAGSSGHSIPMMASSATPTGVSPATERRRLGGFLGEALNVVRRSGGLVPPLIPESNH